MAETIKPSSIEVEEFSLFTDKGEEIDLKKFIVQLSIFEDIFSNVMSGMAIITDNANLVGTLPIIGREIINVRVHVPGFKASIQKAFYVYSVENRNPTSGDRQQTYQLNFMSLEGLADNVTYLSKKYSGSTENIAEVIFNEHLRMPKLWKKSYPFPSGSSQDNSFLSPSWMKQLPQENLTVLHIGGGRPFASTTTFVVPMWTPFKTINWLANRSLDGSNKGPNVLFWESSQQFYFTSMDSIFEGQKEVKNRKMFFYGLDEAAIVKISGQDMKNTLAKGYEKVEELKIPLVTDVLKSQDYGHYGSNMHVLDIVNKEYKEYIYDYASNFEDYKHLDGAKPSFNINTPRNYFSYKTFRPKHTGLFKGSPPADTSMMGRLARGAGALLAVNPLLALAFNKFVNPYTGTGEYDDPKFENWVQPRTSLMYDLSNLRVEITVPGYCDTEAGEVVNFYYPKMGEKGAGEEVKDLIDQYLSGSYLVVAVRHMISETKYTMKLELVKESLSKAAV